MICMIDYMYMYDAVSELPKSNMGLVAHKLWDLFTIFYPLPIAGKNFFLVYPNQRVKWHMNGLLRLMSVIVLFLMKKLNFTTLQYATPHCSL